MRSRLGFFIILPHHDFTMIFRFFFIILSPSFCPILLGPGAAVGGRGIRKNSTAFPPLLHHHFASPSFCHFLLLLAAVWKDGATQAPASSCLN